MKRVITALILIPLVLTLVFMPPRLHWAFMLVTAGVAVLAAWEFLAMAEIGGAKSPRIVVLLAVLLLFAGNYEWPDQSTAILGILSLSLLVICTFTSPVERMMPDIAISILCLFYTGFTLLALPAMQEEANGPSMVTFLLCVVWAGDIAALYVGRQWGRHKLIPRLSPNKTWEGTLGSMACSLLVAGALLGVASFLETWDSARLSYPEGIWYWLGLAVAINIAAQVGDLTESAFKRSVGVKDSGTLLPGHGGVLDRIDALLLAAPVLWYAQLIHMRF
jgi:phosphatidate cytidylyltransferase